jgi:hypothetical protein
VKAVAHEASSIASALTLPMMVALGPSALAAKLTHQRVAIDDIFVDP